MLLELLIAAAAALTAFGLIWLLRGIVLTPVPKGRNMNIRIVLDIRGEAYELENTVEALCWLRKNGTLDAGIVVMAEGLGEETAAVARILAREGRIELKE